MKLVTWNVNSLRARLPRVLELLDEHRPDVVCLQETKTEADAFPRDELGAAGYEAVHHSAGRWAGVAILSTDGLADPARGLPGEPAPDEARWIEATTHGLRVASAYVPNGRALDSPEFPRKLAFLDAVRERARRAGPGALDAVLGDLNVTREDRDVYDPAAFAGATHVSPPERERLEALVAAGLEDAFRVAHPDEVGFTWWDYRQGHFHRRLGLRIDFVLLRDAERRVAECGIDRSYRKGPKPSDHAPLIARLRVGAPGRA